MGEDMRIFTGIVTKMQKWKRFSDIQTKKVQKSRERTGLDIYTQKV